MESNTRTATWPAEHDDICLRWLREGTSVFEMKPDDAVIVQRYIVRDGQPFDEEDYRRRHRKGVISRALAGQGVPSEVLDAHNIDLNKERTTMPTETKTTSAKPRIIEAVAKDDRVWREEPKGTDVKFYTQDSYKGMIDIYFNAGGKNSNLARKPNLKAAVEYVQAREYTLVGVSRVLKDAKELKGVLATPAKKATKKAAKKAAPKATKKAAPKKAAKKATRKAAPKAASTTKRRPRKKAAKA